jgi:molecular chaperone GrpE
MSTEEKKSVDVENQQVEQEVEKTELELLQEKCDQYLAGWQRAKADYSNLQKEMARKQEEMIKFANATVLAELIEIYDNFKLAAQHKPSEESKAWSNWSIGIDGIMKQNKDFLGRFGVEEIKTVGEKFNVELHEAVGGTDEGDAEPDTVVEQKQAGYTLHGKLIKPAKVIIKN